MPSTTTPVTVVVMITGVEDIGGPPVTHKMVSTLAVTMLRAGIFDLVGVGDHPIALNQLPSGTGAQLVAAALAPMTADSPPVMAPKVTVEWTGVSSETTTQSLHPGALTVLASPGTQEGPINEIVFTIDNGGSDRASVMLIYGS